MNTILYFLYEVIDNKTVRAHENFYKKYKKQNKFVLGTLVKTNRGYFIDGKHVDQKSVDKWFALNKNGAIAKTAYEVYSSYLNSLKEE